MTEAKKNDSARPFTMVVGVETDDTGVGLLKDLNGSGSTVTAVIPVGDGLQEFVARVKTEEDIERESIHPVRFVPMTREAQQRP